MIHHATALLSFQIEVTVIGKIKYRILIRLCLIIDADFVVRGQRDMKADYERQTSDISAVLTRLNAERAELANGVDNEHPALVAFMKYQNIEALNREILVELVDYIKVYENGNISVKFKFADELRKIAEYIEINTTEDTAVAG